MPTSTVEITETEMFVPESEALAKRLQDGLRQHFAEATVEWVDCPDLTQEPFNLAAPGLCGDAILLEIGSISQLFPRPRVMFNYHFKDILKELYNNYNNVLVIGAGIGLRQSNQQLGELFVNASFSDSRVTGNSLKLKNQSRLAFLNQATGECALESITDNSNLACYPHGNFFISEGKPGKVLKVQAKNCTGLHFLTAMQYAPLIAVGTLISDSSYYENSCQRAGKNGYGLTQSHFHAYSSNRAGGHFHTEIQPTNAEYLGYFHPAKMFYHMDPQSRYDGLQDFTDIMLYW
ncbi:ester hydrolase C11orf54 homolog [Polyergus mexicanus]|uniref:ester hydrolase C11orf54 homolog n=1 Tax=Polyergus mexicanus TaxID=615972 RepID=UPI0038B52CE8